MFGLFDSNKSFKYHIEKVTLHHFEGWAFHKTQRDPCQVSIQTLGNEVVAEGVADIVRPDLEGRGCGFRLAVRGDLMNRLPGRFLLYVNDVKVANCYVVLPLEAEAFSQAAETRAKTFESLQVERLEREVETLTRQLARLRGQAE